ncbi:MAG TPA: zinc-dependent metalloprotease [Terriglobales bacterium]|nr:zinc-dependent metalloprotease [Terriglobales bacterium]
MRLQHLAVLIAYILLGSAFVQSQEEKPLPTISDMTKQMRKLPGYFPLYWDERAGKLWLEIDKWNTEFLFLDSLAAGVGSNDIGLDRGQLGEERIVKFERSGPKVLLTAVNYGFRASSDNRTEKQAVEDAFAQSVIWGFAVAAEDGDHVLVDATLFFTSDAHHVVETLKKTKQGTFHLDASRSAVYLPNTKNFPQNTEVESTLTFVGEEPGKFVQEVVPDPNAVTVREHYSFVQLPDGNYHPREFDPRAGFFSIKYMDYSAPIGSPIVKRYIARHRLQKKDPSAAISDPVKPIVYYLDPGTPEPVRSALLDGARWWNQAFEAAGYRNAFQVEMLPPGADPMDIRYNMINWVHRSTRGWSYGAAVVDPRTGEIIKGQVTLGSLRVRQDYMIFEGLLAPYKNGQQPDPRMLQAALARLRQLAAHEIGHTLGLQHNYIASTEGRASVMDYPHPWVKLAADGSMDLSQAYATGIGDWDKVTIQYGYSDFPPGTDEHAALNKIIEDAAKRGLTFLTDQDARPPGSASPYTNLWDNGKDPVSELQNVFRVRAAALQRFGENDIPEGTAMAQLQDVFVPIYLYHRYQTEAVTKTIGGLNYTYALRGDGQVPTAPVSGAEQRRALKEVLQTISPEFLAIPDRISKLIPPRPSGIKPYEDFPSHTALTFDPLAAAETSANLTIGVLLDPARAARLIQYHSQDPEQPGLNEVLDALVNATWKSRPRNGELAAVQRVIDEVALNQLMTLAADEKAADEVRAVALFKLTGLRAWLGKQVPLTTDEQQQAHMLYAAAQIRKFEQNPAQVLKPTPVLEAPPGAPIGDTAWNGAIF